MALAQIADYQAFALYDHVDVLTLAVAAKAAELRALGDPGNDLRAAALEKAYVKLIEGIEAAGTYWSVKGTELLREHERESRVRPDTLGGGGVRLADALFTEPLLGGQVGLGIANEEILDNNVPWWPTNEHGSSTQADEGRILFGAFFQPGPESRPDIDEYQEHALFEPRGPGEFRGSGRVVHAIQAKHFIRDAAIQIEAGWRADVLALETAFKAEIP